jgi:protein NirF
MSRRFGALMLLVASQWAVADCALRGTGDLGVVIERASGSVLIVDSTKNAKVARVTGLGDLSHASVVFSRDARYAYVFGRDGGLSKVDLLCQKLDRRIVQAGNSVGGAISQDGRIVAVSNYDPGGVKLFSADTLEPVAEVAAKTAAGGNSKVVGLVDAPGNRFVYSSFEGDEIRLLDLSGGQVRESGVLRGVGRQPYDGNITPDGRFYVAGLFGEDGLALVDLWAEKPEARRILNGYGRGERSLPVYKMPHLEGWAVVGGKLFLPAVGHHRVLVADTRGWSEIAQIPVRSQPVFVVARPDGREVWVNFAFPDNGHIEVIDTEKLRVVRHLEPGPGVMHLEFTPRGEALWLSVRDADKLLVYDTATYQPIASIPADKPSGIFFTHRAHRTGL